VFRARPTRASDHPGRNGKFLPAPDDALAAQADRYLRCRTCGYAITRERDRIRVRDSHEHRCTNPHGIVYRIGCFREAPGVMETGAETLKYTCSRATAGGSRFAAPAVRIWAGDFAASKAIDSAD